MRCRSTPKICLCAPNFENTVAGTYLSGPLFEMARAQGFQRRRKNQKKATQQMQVAEANMRRLGSQAPERLEQIGRFLEAHAGAEGKVAAAALKKLSIAPMVEAFEHLARKIIQGNGARASQHGRNNEHRDSSSIPGFQTMNFREQRSAQMQRASLAAVCREATDVNRANHRPARRLAAGGKRSILHALKLTTRYSKEVS
jgi:hypothetical protein